MQGYRFTDLEGGELREIKALESRLSSRHGQPVILIAYSEATPQTQGVAMQAGWGVEASDPGVYGTESAAKETGFTLLDL